MIRKYGGWHSRAFCKNCGRNIEQANEMFFVFTEVCPRCGAQKNGGRGYHYGFALYIVRRVRIVGCCKTVATYWQLHPKYSKGPEGFDRYIRKH